MSASRLFVVALAGLVVAGCRPRPELPSAPALPAKVDPLPTGTRVTLLRGICYGTCPAYTVEILGDGTVNYFGGDFVRVKGARRKKVSLHAVHRLVRAFVDAGYLSWRDSYDTSVGDDQTVETSLTTTTASKRIAHSGREAFLEDSDPSATIRWRLSGLEREVDEVAGTAEWVRCPGGQLGRCDEDGQPR